MFFAANGSTRFDSGGGTNFFTQNLINMKPILVTTQHRGVWYAEVGNDKDLTTKTLTDLKNCRMAIYWNTKHGLHELCKVGPNEGSRISSPADIEVLHDVTAVFSVTDQAAEAWKNH